MIRALRTVRSWFWAPVDQPAAAVRKSLTPLADAFAPDALRTTSGPGVVSSTERARIHDVPLAEYLALAGREHTARTLLEDANARVGELTALLRQWDTRRRLSPIRRAPLEKLIPDTMRALGMDPVFRDGCWSDRFEVD